MRPYIPHLVSIALAAAGPTSLAQKQPTPNICNVVNKDRYKAGHTTASIYLLDAAGKLSAGPVDFGTFEYTSCKSEFIFYVPTAYRVLASSKWIAPANSDIGGSLKLTRTTSVCPGLPTFNVSLVSRYIPPENLPWRWNSPVNESNFEDTNPRAEFGTNIIFRFDGRVLGTIVKATARNK